MSIIFSNVAQDIEFYLNNKSLIPLFKDCINLFNETQNDTIIHRIENYINLGGYLNDYCCASHYGNGNLIEEEFGLSAGIYACKYNDNRILEILKKHKYDNFNYVLHKAINENAIEQVKWLLQENVNINVNFMWKRGKTPLYMAIRNKSIDMVKLLLDNGANPNLKYAVCQYTYLDLAIDEYEIQTNYNEATAWEQSSLGGTAREQSSLEKITHLVRDITDIQNIIELLLSNGAVTNKKTWPVDTSILKLGK